MEDRSLADRLRQHVVMLAETIGPRSVPDYTGLQRAAEYIETHWRGLGYDVESQWFRADGREVRNLAVELPGEDGQVFVVGAHYDSVFGTPGANDNASGVAAVLELARSLHGGRRNSTVRLAAFVNEEPPYFHTAEMGSLVYARRCRERGEKVAGMLSLETIGYYSDEPGSQQYPGGMQFGRSDRGNFIGFVGNIQASALLEKVLGTFREKAEFPAEGAAAPEEIPGVAWSDHWAFWQAGYPALMVTDTAPFRYPHYHTMRDTPDKIDYDRTARVVVGLQRVIEELAGQASTRV